MNFVKGDWQKMEKLNPFRRKYIRFHLVYSAATNRASLVGGVGAEQLKVLQLREKINKIQKIPVSSLAWATLYNKLALSG